MGCLQEGYTIVGKLELCGCCHQKRGSTRSKPARTVAAAGFRDHRLWSRLRACKLELHRWVRNRHAVEVHGAILTAFASRLAGGIRQQRLRNRRQDKRKCD